MQRFILLTFFLLPVLISFGQYVNPLDRVNVKTEDFQETLIYFSIGEAKTGEEYYMGILAGLILIDAPVKDFTSNTVRCLAYIELVKSSLKLYEKKDWPQRKEMHKKTLALVNSVNGLIKNYLVDLSEPLSRADETWSNIELDFYDKYIDAHNKYLEIDEDWVAFQYKFCKANDFIIEGTINIDDLEEGTSPENE